jgi:hypothetical protein
MVVPAKAGTAVAGDYTTPGDRSFLLCNDYLGVPEPELDPEPLPMPPLLLPPVLGAGVGVGLVVELPELLPPVEPLPLAPAAPLRASCRHFSRSAPVRLTHLLGVSLDAPAEPLAPEPDEPLAPVLPDGEPED